MLNPILIAVFAAAAAPAPAFVDYVFTVPVRIENMSHITVAWVSCGLTHIAPGGARYDVAVPGTGRVDIPVRDGSFTGNLTATVTASPDHLARGHAPTNWGCFVAYRFRLPDGSEFMGSLANAERAAAYTRSTGQEITLITAEVSGTIPTS